MNILRRHIFILSLLCMLMQGCYYSHPERLEPWQPADGETIDSVDFRTRHHYWKGFNFEATDTIRLTRRPPQQTPEDVGFSDKVLTQDLLYPMSADSMLIHASDPLVVADIMYVPQDTIDSVWVKVARDQGTQGWVREKVLTKYTVADAPISRFIHFFSDSRTIIFVSVLGVFILLLILTLLFRQNKAEYKDANKHPLRRVLNQIGISAGLLAPGGWRGAYRSFYPTLLCLTISAATALYCSIQHFVPSTWVEYYYHPTLNPFSPDLPPIMQLFVASVWLLVVVSVAVVIELWREEESAYLLSHIAGLACICVLIYLVLTLTVSFYVGYILLAAYWIFALWRYFHRRPARYRCGLCGEPLEELGTCPNCGADNK